MGMSLFRGVAFLVVCAVSASAQAGRRMVPRNSDTSAMSATTVFLSGRVTLDGGELTEPAAIQTICYGDRHIETYTDNHGSFSFQFGRVANDPAAGVDDATSSTMTPALRRKELSDWRSCELQATLAGFSSEPVTLSTRMHTLESTDFGRITLHRLEHVEGTSISVTSALAPAAAQKALEKGRLYEKKGKWSEAQKSFEKAVQVYPNYAAAWNELGLVQMHDHDETAAKCSFERALAADPKYVNPYRGLAQVAFHAGRWQEVLGVAGSLVALDPVDFPDAYLLSGIANYNLQNLQAAEKSAWEGIRLDQENKIAQLHYLLGVILLHKHDYQQASEQMQIFLRFAKSPAEIEFARKQVAEMARLSTSLSAVGAIDERLEPRQAKTDP